MQWSMFSSTRVSLRKPSYSSSGNAHEALLSGIHSKGSIASYTLVEGISILDIVFPGCHSEWFRLSLACVCPEFNLVNVLVLAFHHNLPALESLHDAWRYLCPHKLPAVPNVNIEMVLIAKQIVLFRFWMYSGLPKVSGHSEFEYNSATTKHETTKLGGIRALY